jgi:nucleotide-binding universal stress UspA family protein
MARDLILGYDDSPGARAALEAAIELASDLGDRIVIAFGYEPPGDIGEELTAARAAVREIGERVAHHALSRATAAGVEAELAVIDARPVDALLELAEAHDARMIIVGSYGESPIRGAILGSVLAVPSAD